MDCDQYCTSVSAERCWLRSEAEEGGDHMIINVNVDIINKIASSATGGL